MTTSQLNKEISPIRDEVIQLRKKSEPDMGMRRFTYAALTTAAVCTVYGLAKCLFDIDLINDDYFSIPTHRIVMYTGIVSGLVSGIGLGRRHQENKTKREYAAKKEELDTLMIDLAREEHEKNRRFVQNYGNQRRSDFDNQ